MPVLIGSDLDKYQLGRPTLLCNTLQTNSTTQNSPLMQASCHNYMWNGSAHLVNHLIWGGRRAGTADTHFMA